jgi:hypothetical protein
MNCAFQAKHVFEGGWKDCGCSDLLLVDFNNSLSNRPRGRHRK